MNLKFKTAMIGNREHVILDNANNLSDFRGKYADLKHLACSVADHLNKPVIIPAFLVVDDLASIEKIKALLAEKCINPIVINTQTNAQKSSESSAASDENCQQKANGQHTEANGTYVNSRNKYNQQQHPFLIQTLSNDTNKAANIDCGAHVTQTAATPVQNVVFQTGMVKTEEEVTIKVEKVAEKPARKPRAPRTKKAATLQNGAVFAATPQANGNISQHVMNIHSSSAQMFDSPTHGGQVNKQPLQTCAEILLKTIESNNNNNNAYNSMITNANVVTPGKMNQQNGSNNVLIMSGGGNGNTPNSMKLEQKKPRIQKINEILMSNGNNTSNQVIQIVANNNNNQHQIVNNQMLGQNIITHMNGNDIDAGFIQQGNAISI
jgi:hypothetical protein